MTGTPTSFLTLLCLGLAASIRAVSPGEGPRFHGLPETEIARSLAALHKAHPKWPERFEAVSAAFLGIPYKLGPMGEGPEGEFDRSPTHTFKELDCTTYVEEAMALSLESDLDRAKALLQKIRYKDGKVSYETRNHFTEVDWRASLEAAGFLKEITRDVAGGRTGVIHKPISKRAWHTAHTLQDVKGFADLTQPELEAKLKRMQELGAQFQDEISTITYVPLAVLPEVLDRIPSATVGNLVREVRPDKPVAITHQILFVVKDGRRFVRHANYGHEVEEVPAEKFFARYDGASWRVLGVNLEQVRDRR
ncbi:MAG: DUF1460 domain-containing protein [Elusimicrobia bacterium]|nr:DUF1460 domain-containing protein [Elusimicrobiota bacterium]